LQYKEIRIERKKDCDKIERKKDYDIIEMRENQIEREKDLDKIDVFGILISSPSTCLHSTQRCCEVNY